MDIKNLLSHSEYIENKSEDICSICLEKIKINSICKKLSCNHKFHCKCIDIWLSENNNCPVCRHEFINNKLNNNEIIEIDANNLTINVINNIAHIESIQSEFDFSSFTSFNFNFTSLILAPSR